MRETSEHAALDAFAEPFQDEAHMGVDQWIMALRAFLFLVGGMAALGLVSVT